MFNLSYTYSFLYFQFILHQFDKFDYVQLILYKLTDFLGCSISHIQAQLILYKLAAFWHVQFMDRTSSLTLDIFKSSCIRSLILWDIQLILYKHIGFEYSETCL